MNAREHAELRDRITRAVLASEGEVLSEIHRRPQRKAVGAAERCSTSHEQTRAVASPLTRDDLAPDERSIFDDLIARVDVSIAAVNVVEHFALVARDTVRARRAARGVA